jgi:hypothetical protein
VRAPLLIALVALTAQAAAAQTPPHHGHAPGDADPREPGQAAFAAVAEIVARLEAEPTTDWSRVDLAALREHLVDMDEVMLRAVARVEPLPGGIAVDVTGDGRTRDAIRRMVPTHAAELDRMTGWDVRAESSPEGVRLVVTRDDPASASRIRGLGFFGLMATGGHHQAHHLAIARGEQPHL